MYFIQMRFYSMNPKSSDCYGIIEFGYVYVITLNEIFHCRTKIVSILLQVYSKSNKFGKLFLFLLFLNQFKEMPLVCYIYTRRQDTSKIHKTSDFQILLHQIYQQQKLQQSEKFLNLKFKSIASPKFHLYTMSKRYYLCLFTHIQESRISH